MKNGANGKKKKRVTTAVSDQAAYMREYRAKKKAEAAKAGKAKRSGERAAKKAGKGGGLKITHGKRGRPPNRVAATPKRRGRPPGRADKPAAPNKLKRGPGAVHRDPFNPKSPNGIGIFGPEFDGCVRDYANSSKEIAASRCAVDDSRPTSFVGVLVLAAVPMGKDAGGGVRCIVLGSVPTDAKLIDYSALAVMRGASGGGFTLNQRALAHCIASVAGMQGAAVAPAAAPALESPVADPPKRRGRPPKAKPHDAADAGSVAAQVAEPAAQVVPQISAMAQSEPEQTDSQSPDGQPISL